jgi:hypothetical protein
MNNLPTFIIIGTMKGGTTSLHRYLASHSEVSVSKRKVDSAALRSETSSQLRNIFEFVGGAPDHEVPNVDQKFHATSEKLRRSFIDRHLKQGALRRTLGTLLPSRLTKPQPFEVPALSREDSTRLADTLRNDIERFRALTGMRFGNWSV